jgi:xanthine dehydrogenase accessory factor
MDAHPGELALWPAEGVPPECFWDFDTPEDLARLHQPRFHGRPVSADQAVQPPPSSEAGADLGPGHCPGLVIIKGAGDLATGVAHRLCRAGYRLLMTELPRPTAIRRTVAFSQAVYDGSLTVEGITARRAGPDDFQEVLAAGEVPVLAGPDPEWLAGLPHRAFIEATLAKRRTGVSRRPGRVTLALGPGHQAGRDVDAVVETDRGHFLGRLILDGCARPDTGRPGIVGGHDLTRLIRSPAAGVVRFDAVIGQTVRAGDVLGRAGGAEIRAAIDGVLRGAIQNGLAVPENFKIGDIDPRPDAAGFIHTPSDKARAVAGGVLEGLLYFGVAP